MGQKGKGQGGKGKVKNSLLLSLNLSPFPFTLLRLSSPLRLDVMPSHLRRAPF
jgi:hypothetical protein